MTTPMMKKTSTPTMKKTSGRDQVTTAKWVQARFSVTNDFQALHSGRTAVLYPGCACRREFLLEYQETMEVGPTKVWLTRSPRPGRAPAWSTRRRSLD